MAIEKSISKLQNQVDKLEKDNIRLRDLLAVKKEKKQNASKTNKIY